MDGTLIHASVEHRPGAIRLDGFPLLTHAPEQWGEGVRTEDNGTPVDAIFAAYHRAPEIDQFESIAVRFGTTEAHVRQAVAYTIANGTRGQSRGALWP